MLLRVWQPSEDWLEVVGNFGGHMRLYSSGAVYSCTVPVLDNVLLYSSWEGGRMIRSCRKSRREASLLMVFTWFSVLYTKAKDKTSIFLLNPVCWEWRPQCDIKMRYRQLYWQTRHILDIKHKDRNSFLTIVIKLCRETTLNPALTLNI